MIKKLLVDEHEMAEMLSVSVSFVQKDRVNSKTIPYLKIGGAIRYHPETVMATLLAICREGGKLLDN